MRPRLVFTGPTLSHAEASRETDAILLLPAAQGSIVAAVQHFDPAAILIIDGAFQSEPAVRHKEIFWAISRGVHVIGAASMGALRAAELHPLMIGVGLIYRWYRRFVFAPDDAVAVWHGPEEVGFAPLTQALIDLRFTLRAARRQGLISPELATSLDMVAGRLNFRDRTLARLCRDTVSARDEAEALQEKLATVFIHAKKRDALQAVRFLSNEAFGTPLTPRDFIFTAAFLRDLEQSGLTI